MDETFDIVGRIFFTRMVETVYARRRHEGVMKHLEALEARNS